MPSPANAASTCMMIVLSPQLKALLYCKAVGACKAGKAMALPLFEPSFRKVRHQSWVHDLAAKLAYTLVRVHDMCSLCIFVSGWGQRAACQSISCMRKTCWGRGFWYYTAHVPHHKGFTSDGPVGPKRPDLDRSLSDLQWRSNHQI